MTEKKKTNKAKHAYTYVERVADNAIIVLELK